MPEPPQLTNSVLPGLSLKDCQPPSWWNSFQLLVPAVLFYQSWPKVHGYNGGWECRFTGKWRSQNAKLLIYQPIYIRPPSPGSQQDKHRWNPVAPEPDPLWLLAAPSVKEGATKNRTGDEGHPYWEQVRLTADNANQDPAVDQDPVLQWSYSP